MQLPDVLPPVAHPLRAELLLDRQLPLDPESIGDALAKRGLPRDTERSWERSGDDFRRALKGGGEVSIIQRAVPRELESLTAQIEHGTTGWDASPVRRHTHVVGLSVASSELSASRTSRILVSIVAALADLADEDHVTVLGTLMGGLRLVPAQMVQLSARMHPAVSVLAGVHRGLPGDDFLFRTSGLSDLGLPELVVEQSTREPDQIVTTLQDLIYRLITEGASALSDGATVGAQGNRVVVLSASPPSREGVDVYEVTDADEQGDVPEAEDARESVVCPECKRTVSVEVMRFALVPLMLKCPECGAGPVALLDKMLETMGGGAVKLTIESDDVSAIATLMANNDPAFPTVIEASDYLRERYANGRVEVTMQRVYATMLYSDAERHFANVRVTSDAALGVSRPGSGIFNSPTSDSIMQDAIAAARASLPAFVARLDAPQPGDVNFGVKFPFREGEQTEHIWLSHIRRVGDKFVGIVSATPRYVKKVSKGTTVRVPIGKVSDWAYGNGDALHGQYTLRVMLHTLPQPMRRDMEARLVPLERA